MVTLPGPRNVLPAERRSIPKKKEAQTTNPQTTDQALTDRAASILTPEDLDNFLKDNSDWRTQSVSIQGVQYLIPYKISGAKITKITVDPGNSGIIKIESEDSEVASKPTELFIARSLFNPITSRSRPFNVISYHEAGQANEEELHVNTFVYGLANGNIQTIEAFRFDFTNMNKPTYLGILTDKEQTYSDEGNNMRSSKYWKKMDKLFYTTMKDARTAFKTN